MQYKKYHLKRLFRELRFGLANSESSTGEFDYLKTVKKALNDENIFENFRSEKGYKDILEHVNKELAIKYYKNLIKDFSHDEILNYCGKISKIGNPEMIKINSSNFNPTSLRYLNVALDIKKKFPGRNFERITEIGPGYGGQSLILDQFFDIKEYRYVDLPDVNLLIEKFLSFHGVSFNTNYFTIESFDHRIETDLFISNYAFSELPKKIQKLVINKIIEKSKFGYMIVNNFYNFSFKFMNINEYKKYIDGLEIFEEVPNSYLFNKTLIFNKKS